jgi:hypothetical protein
MATGQSGFTEDKGLTLADFGAYFLCEGQQQADNLGYSPLPVNLVIAGQAQIERIPGGDPVIKGTAQCNNPTLDPSDPNGNALAKKAPYPEDCDKRGASQCLQGTGGAKDIPPDQTANNSDPTGGAGGGSTNSDSTGAGDGADQAAATAAAALAGDADALGLGDDATAVELAAASPQSIPARAISPTLRLAMVGAALLAVAAAVVPLILARRSRRRPARKLPALAAASPLPAGPAAANLPTIPREGMARP